MPHTLITGLDGRKYQTYELTAPGITATGNSGIRWRGFDPGAMGRHWANSHSTMDEWDHLGLIHWPANGGFPRRRSADPFEESSRIVTVGDVWTDIDRLNQTAAERIGYPTQKPLSLLERIISASSRPGDVVLDPFCGCGTTIDAAERLGRHWIGIDIAFIAIDIIRKRLSRNYGRSASYELQGSPRDLAGADALFQRDEFEFQTWAVTQLDAEPNEKRSGDKGVDGAASFYINRMTTGKVIISVKGGRNVKPEHVRDLAGTVATQKAQMGILIMRAEPSPGVRDAANHAGTYTWPLNGQTYPKVQIVTVSQLLGGVRPAIPTHIMPYTRRARIIGAIDAASLISGKMLVHARPTDIEPLLGIVDGTRSGLVLTGTTGIRVAAKRRRDRGVDCPIIVDPATYQNWKATPQDPFRSSNGSLHGRSLDNFIREICKEGADAVLTPTGYIEAGDVNSLAAVLDAAPTVSSKTIISLPLDNSWLTLNWIDIFIEMAAATPAPKALMLNELPRKPSVAKEILANLRLIASDVSQIGLFRASLTAFDMFAYGALAGAIGSSNALRRLNPPDNQDFSGNALAEESGNSPEVLIADLVTYLPGNLLTERSNSIAALVCHCRHCSGRQLTRFVGKSEWLDARLHNFAVWTEWLPGLLAEASLTQRQLSWIRHCRRGIEKYDSFTQSADNLHPNFVPDLPLLLWAGQTSPRPSMAAELRMRRADPAARASYDTGTTGAP